MALIWALDVGDTSRFRTIKEAISYCGLFSAEKSSADKPMRTPISKQRNKHIQQVLVEAARRKFIKYNHLVANLLIFHNVVTMSNALGRLVAEGYAWDADLIACSSPYLTGHLNRFGLCALNRHRVPEPLDSVREFKMPPHGEKLPRAAQVAV